MQAISHQNERGTQHFEAFLHHQYHQDTDLPIQERKPHFIRQKLETRCQQTNRDSPPHRNVRLRALGRADTAPVRASFQSLLHSVRFRPRHDSDLHQTQARGRLPLHEARKRWKDPELLRTCVHRQADIRTLFRLREAEPAGVVQVKEIYG